jgi:ribonuclease BN (tRNA processing enzyme)
MQLFAGASLPVVKESFSSQTDMSSVTFLGTGPGNVVAGHFQSSILLEVGGKRILLDAGEPCSAQLLDLGFRLPDLDAIWITHAHADHIGGLPLLIQANWLHGRSQPLPVGVPKHLAGPLRAWLDTILLSSEVTHYPLEIFSWESGRALVMDTVEVSPFPTTHLEGLRKLTGNDQVESFLFAITVAERRIVYSGDLGAPSDLTEVLKAPLDLLICELSHFTPEDLLGALRGARIGTLCLTHMASDFDERRGEIQMLMENEPGIDSVYLPEDGERIDF